MWVRIGRAIAAHGAQERKHMLAHHGVHLGWCEVLEARPTQVVVIPPLGIFTLRENASLYRLVKASGLVFFKGVQVIKPAQEQQVSNLLHHLHGIGDAARPEGVPDTVDLTAKFAGEHVPSLLLLFR